MLQSFFPKTAKVVDARTGTTWSQPDMCDQAASRAAKLAQAGGSSGKKCVIAVPAAAEALLWLLGAWSAGMTAVLINPGVTQVERDNIIARTRADLWVGAMGDGDNDVDDQITQLTSGLKPTSTKGLGLDDPALILMTSGTTGVPKGIVHTLRSLSARIALNTAHIGEDALRNSLCVLPVFFGHGLIGNCLTPLAAGGKLVLFTGPSTAEVAAFWSVLDTHDITFMSSVPTFWKLVTRLSPSPETPLERVHVGSAPLSIEQWEAIAVWSGTRNVWNLFGMTETANWIGGGVLEDSHGRDGYVGKIWGGQVGVQVDGTVLPSGRGEVVVRTPSIMTEYFEQPDVTQQAFHDGWFRTGDIGELTEDGDLTLVGRTKFEINRGGLKVQAEEIDMMLERHPAVIEACAFGIPDAAAGEAVAAAIVIDQSAAPQLETAQIIEWCRTQVRAEAVPAKLFVVDSIARNERGKIQRGTVRANLLHT